MNNQTSLLRGDRFPDEVSRDSFWANDGGDPQACVLLIDDDHTARQVVGTY